MAKNALTKKRTTYVKETKAYREIARRLKYANDGKKKWMAKAKESEKTGPIIAVTCSVSGGAIAGLIESKMPQIGGAISTNLVVGTAGVALGVFMPKMPMANQLLCLSTGMLAKWSGDLAEDLANGGSLSPMALVGGQ